MINIKWTNEAIQKEALKYKTRIDFKKKSNKSYNAAQRRNILKDVCEHMIDTKTLQIRKKTIWNLVTIKKEAKKYKTKKDFELFASGAYSAAKKNKILHIVCKHMIKPKKIFKNEKEWNIDTVTIEAQKYNSRTDFKKGNRSAFVYSESNKLLDKICKHMVKKIGKYDTDRMTLVKVNSKNCKSRVEFYKRYPSDYSWCSRYHLLPFFCKHMVKTSLIKNQAYWTKENLQKEGLKYTTRNKFRILQPGAYDAAQRLKILDEICKHMNQVLDHREIKFQKKIKTILKRMFPTLNILKEKRIIYNKNRYCIPDFTIYDHKQKIVIILELKHDESRWSKKSITEQLNKYKRIKIKNYKKNIFLVSPKGKYGIKLNIFLQKIKTLI